MQNCLAKRAQSSLIVLQDNLAADLGVTEDMKKQEEEEEEGQEEVVTLGSSCRPVQAFW